MKLHRSILACGILSLLIFPAFTFSAFGQATSSDQSKSHERNTPQSRDVANGNVSEELNPGIVVEEVKKNSEGERAGLREGDILLSWRRGDAKGVFESPFDLYTIAIEQAAYGEVTLEGIRGMEKRHWLLGWNIWGIEGRPNFTTSI